MTGRPRATVATAAARGAPPRDTVARAVVAGAAAQLVTVALVGGATALLTWASRRPGLGAIAGLLVAVELVAFLRAPLRHAARSSAHDLGLDGLRGWRTWLLDSVATWSPSRLAAARAGDLLTRCLEDTDALQDLWVRVLVPVASTLVALVLASIALAIVAPLAGGALAVATAIVAATSWFSSSSICSLGVEESELRGTIAARVVELARGAEPLALLGAEASHIATTTSLVRRADGLAARRDASIARLVLLAAASSAGALLVAAGTVPVPSHNAAPYAGAVLAVLACAELLASLPAALDALGPIAGAAVRLDQLANAVPTASTPAERGALELAHVGVAADPRGSLLVEDASLLVEPGSSMSVGGPTGAGKSSLLAIAARLELRRGGVVSLGGVDLDALDEASLRRRVSWVPDTPTLLEGRVRDVLDVGRGLSDARLLGAIEKVGLTETLRPRGGLDAVLGSRGAELSGGERRRMAIARVLAGEPDLYVLDEPTAGLDPASVAVVLAALERSGAGVLVATHDDQVAAWATERREIRGGRLSELSR